MKKVLLTLAALAVAGASAGAAVVFFGLYNVSARVPHWPIVHWALHTTYENAVELRAMAESEAPDLSAPGLAALGAGHFDSACAFCHGRPGEVQSATALSMNPVPPHVEKIGDEWSPAELHWIVYEGVKMSGMPHWPATRKDEVWPLVAYIEAAAEGVAPVHPAPAGGTPALAYCAGCHGTSGRSDNPLIPRLDLQTEAYLSLSLDAYRDGLRQSGFMEHAARMVGPADLKAMLLHYATQDSAPEPGQTGGKAVDADLLARGEALARRGTDDVPACTACHGPGGARENALMPRLEGQHLPYLAAQLKVWRAGGRGGGERMQLMRKAAQDLTDADIAALAAWYASLPARPVR